MLIKALRKELIKRREHLLVRSLLIAIAINLGLNKVEKHTFDIHGY